jgi:DNA-binding NarL/FixJ family response regulator
MPRRSLQLLARFSLVQAALLFFKHIHSNKSTPLKPISRKLPAKTERNLRIRQKFEAGEAVTDIAEEFGISAQRVSQIIYGKRS